MGRAATGGAKGVCRGRKTMADGSGRERGRHGRWRTGETGTRGRSAVEELMIVTSDAGAAAGRATGAAECQACSGIVIGLPVLK